MRGNIYKMEDWKKVTKTGVKIGINAEKNGSKE